MITLRQSIPLLALLGMVAVSGCSTMQRQPPPDPGAAWRAQQQVLQQLTGWELRGRIAIRSSSDGVNANLHWRQQADRYRIRLSGPFGAGAVTLSGDRNGVTMRDRGRLLMRHGDAERLLYQQSGVRLPVASLGYWVRAMPRPGSGARVLLDRMGRLKELRQDGWRIRYRRYLRNRGVELPSRLLAENGQLRVRLVIDRWVVTRMRRAGTNPLSG
ncbi:MAG TPA: outer membrane lipoprotein LolB [Gammaproteobacteria bacterium]|nr:outer membrane lipoprotein LolB [Gammaproteobacteria bacterium]